MQLEPMCFQIILQVLLAQGANTEAQEKDQWTPLMLASKKGYLSVVEVKYHMGCFFNQALVPTEFFSLLSTGG